MKTEGQKKNYLNIGAGDNNKYFFKVNLDPWFLRNQKSLLKHVYHVVVVYSRINFDKLYFLLFLTTTQ